MKARNTIMKFILFGVTSPTIGTPNKYRPCAEIDPERVASHVSGAHHPTYESLFVDERWSSAAEGSAGWVDA